MATSKKSEVIRLAEGCKWIELKTLVEKDPGCAQERDRFGMIPLHWACTDPNTPQDVLMLLLKAYPAGARMYNSGKLLPLHIAIKAQASIEWLQALLANYPEASIALTPSNEDVVTLARKYKLPAVSINILEEMRDHVQKTGYRSGSHTTDDEAEEFDEGNRQDSILASSRVDTVRSNSTMSARPYDSFSSEQHMSLHMTPIEIDDNPPPHASQFPANSAYGYNRPALSLPPRWSNAPNCHICSCKFGTFKKRHHCRNCGQSICTDHSAKHKHKLPHYGITTRQRVCVMCHDALTTSGGMPPPIPVVEQPMMMTSQRSSLPLSSSRTMGQPPRSQPGILYPPTFSSQRSYTSDKEKDNVIQDMNLQVQLLQQQVTRLMEEKQQAEALLMRHTGSSDSQQKLSNEEIVPVLPALPQPEPEVRVVHEELPPVRPSWEQEAPRETSLTDHDVVHDTYSRDTYTDANYDILRDSRYTLDDRDTFFEKYLNPTASRPDIPETAVEVEEEQEEEEPPFDESAIESSAAEDGLITAEENEADDETIQEVDTLVTLGMTMMQKGSTSGAVAAFERAVELLPNDPILHSYLGKACYADEDLDRAVRAISRSLELEPSAANWTLLGKILFEKGDTDSAIEAYQKSLEIQNRVG
ncbi:unnamed protein product [Aphanomyces euteiches]|uniref:FYVE-type domain-containing protein n=1 Tax=Aphanomyces euteiches TaxID=100861 RepID=A0A6G0WKJ7_9STRA|nr:hypothetical protein Ae201684_014240 [Aphanomyces euteiches]KAH9069270.1 hypothetical protein Ae201684P_004958 [Aphanomyces euteiches]KAH9153552.1 hypothetical protein AeRB84_004207 [Aphanomyces euteiches]